MQKKFFYIGFKKIFFFVVLLFIIIIFISVLFLIIYNAKALSYYNESQSIKVRSFIKDDPIIGFTQKENLQLIQNSDFLFSIFTDELGARISSIRDVSSPKEVDILNIGCSYTWGDGINNEETYASLLEKSTKLKVYNIGLPSYSTVTSFLRFKEFVHLKPKIIIYGYIEDHLERNIHPCAPTFSPLCRPNAYIKWSKENKPLIEKPMPIGNRYYKYMEQAVSPHNFGLIDYYWAFKRDIYSALKQDWRGLNALADRDLNENHRMEAFDLALNEIQKSTQEINAKLIVVAIPYPGNPAKPNEIFYKMREKYPNVDFIDDLHIEFKNYEKENGATSLFASSPNNGHTNRIANQFIANYLKKRIDKWSEGATFGKKQ